MKKVMKKVTNTSKEVPTHQVMWLGGGNPNAIENQEAEGQKEFEQASQLPRKCNSPYNITNTAEQYSKMGIKVLVPSKGDDIFLGVKLPKGWKVQSTDHSMWNNLIDDKGRVRAMIFYKAAFYDRDSFINFEHRYISTSEYLERKDSDNFYPKFYCVKDNATKKIIFTTEITNEHADPKLEKKCIDFLKKEFPKYENLNAYWD